MVTGATSRYFFADHLGSTTALTDSSGNVSSSASYDSFGNATGNLSTRYAYTGREFDNFTGLHFYRNRWYDGKLGRFISEDPIGFAGGDSNLYSYVGNKSLSSNDPSGLFPSRARWKYHQNITRKALFGFATPMESEILADEQFQFDKNTQEEEYAAWHSMSRRNQSPEDARRESNQFVRNQICMARKLKGMGLRNQALRALSRGMHTLQDSSSPAHFDFQPAWEDTYWNRTKEFFGGHYWQENFEPGEGSVAYDQTRKAWSYYNGIRMPDDFFTEHLQDSSDGLVFSPSQTRRSPDGGNCGCN